MTSGNVWKLLLGFAAPMALGLLFQQLYNTVDMLVVGRYVGKEALAAVGSTSSIVNMLVGLFAGISTGAGVVISRYFGAHDEEMLSEAVSTTMCVTFIMCVIATALGLALIDPMLELMDTPTDVLSSAREYLVIFIAGMSGLLIYNMGSGILRAVGDSYRPLLFLIFSAVVNTVLDIFFVAELKMGVSGVAYATILSEAVSAVAVLYVLTRCKAAYAIKWRKLKIVKSTLKDIIDIGFPSGIQQAITAFSNVFVQSYINFFGTACMAGWSVYNKLDVFILIPVQSYALASATFVGQNAGAGNLPRAKSGIRHSLVVSLAVTAALSAALMILAMPLVSLFSDEKAVIDFGVKFLQLISPFYFTICFNQIFAGALRGIGRARTPMLIMLFSFVVFRQIYLYIVKASGNSFILVSLAYPAGWVVCSLLMIAFYMASPLFKSVLPKKEKNENTDNNVKAA